jgi:hypothetical protein
MSVLPSEAEKLLGVAPDEFVAERQALVRRLRDEDRVEEADAVTGLRKPSAVVFAVNRAARDRPNAAKAAAAAAQRVAQEQAGGDQERFRAAVRELDEALDLLGEVAVAHVSPGRKPTDAMRRRVHDLLRRAVAHAETRTALERGVLLEEQEAVGFAPFEGVAGKKPRRKAPTARPETRTSRRAEQRREQAQALRRELAEAKEALGDAQKAVRAAERERAKAERAVEAIEAKLDRLTRST